jgi:hypothetical protein
MPKLLFQWLCPKTNFRPTITDELQYRSQREQVTRAGVCQGAHDVPQIHAAFDVGCRSRSSLFDRICKRRMLSSKLVKRGRLPCVLA